MDSGLLMLASDLETLNPARRFKLVIETEETVKGLYDLLSAYYRARPCPIRFIRISHAEDEQEGD